MVYYVSCYSIVYPLCMIILSVCRQNYKSFQISVVFFDFWKNFHPWD